MKISIFLLFAGILSAFAGSSYSQSARVSLNLKNTSIENVLNEIEKKSEFFFLFNQKLIDVNRKVDIIAENQPIKEILANLFEKQDVAFVVLDRQIILSPKEEAMIAAESGQAIKITGIVKSADAGETLPGANVQVIGTKNYAITNADGKFEILADKPDAELTISYVGYLTQTVSLNGQSSIEINLLPDLKALDEVIVIGYGIIKKKDMTGAVAVVKSDDLKSEGTNSAIKSLQGMVAGVNIESAGGSPGSGNRVLIRGTSTINGNPNPLYIVDGVPVDNIDNIPSSDIESMSVLKDASAAAIYGARGSTGVVLVTTKMGKKGENKIDFKASYGIQQLPKKISVLNAHQWALVNDSARSADGKPFLAIAQNPDSLGAGTDFQKEIYRTGQVREYNLSMSGGNDNYSYGLSGGYYGNDGIVKETNDERYSLRIKSEYTKKRLRVGESIILSSETILRIPGANGQGGNPVSSALKMIPIYNVYNSNSLGGYDGGSGDIGEVANPVAMLNLTKNWDEYNKVFINLFAELELLKDLKYKYNIGYNKQFDYNHSTTQSYQLGSSTLFKDTANVSETRAQTNFFLQEHTLNFNKTFGKHSFNAVAGFTLQTKQYRTLAGKGRRMAPSLWVLDAAQQPDFATGHETDNALLSYLGRIVYSYNDIYLLTGSIRRDGSSKFGAKYRYGNFPSIALGWNVANEQFFNPIKESVNTLKLRVSYGELGNEQIPEYLYATTLSPNFNYVMGNKLWTGSIQTGYASKDIKWEAAKTTNFGADLGFFKNKLTLTADYFIKTNTDLLIQVPIPPSAGATSTPWVNYGKITNKGLELGLSYKDQLGDLFYNVYGTFTTVKNVVDELGTGKQQIIAGYPSHHGDGVTLTQAGYPVGSFYLIKTAGLFQTQDEINNYIKTDSLGQPILNSKGQKQLIQPSAKPGDVKFVDANHDGKIDAKDKVVVGNPSPKFEYSYGLNLNWKGIDATIFFQGVYGNKIYNGLKMDLSDIVLNWNYSTDVLNHWTPTHTNTNIPRLTIDDRNLNNRESDRFLEDGSYLRIKTVQIGYTFPKNWLTTIGFDVARIYASFENLYTFTKYSGFNPDLGRASIDWRDGLLERGVDYGHVEYPLPRTMTCGIQLTF